MHALSLSPLLFLCVFAACSAAPGAEPVREAATAEPAPAPRVVISTDVNGEQIRPAPDVARPQRQPAARGSEVSVKPKRVAQKQPAAPPTAAAPAAGGGASTTVPKTELYYWDSCMMVVLAVPPHCDR